MPMQQPQQPISAWELVQANEALALKFARSVKRKGSYSDLEDLLQEARLAIYDAAFEWEPERGAFEVIAFYKWQIRRGHLWATDRPIPVPRRVLMSMSRAENPARSEDEKVRRAFLAQRCKQEPDEPEHAPGAAQQPSPPRQVAGAEAVALIRGWVYARFSERDAGLWCALLLSHAPPLETEIAQRLGITRQAVNLIKKRITADVQLRWGIHT